MANDTLIGNDKNNRLTSGRGNDTLKGMGGDDTLSSGAGNDNLDGGTGNDQLIGGLGVDTLLGGDGDDIVVQNLEQGVSDTIKGGADVDTVDYNTAVVSTTGIVANLSLGTVYKNGTSDNSSKDTLEDIENVVGTEIGDELTGNDKANVLKGMGGNDALLGGAGNDQLEGGAGTDELTGGLGADTLLGGDGDDTIFQDLEKKVIDTLNGGSGVDTVDYSRFGMLGNAGNLIVNGEFDQDLKYGIDTHYFVVPSTYVAIVTGAVSKQASVTFVDGTRISGVNGISDSFLAVNGATWLARVWRQAVSLEAGVSYQFSYKVASSFISPAYILTLVNGTAPAAPVWLAAAGPGWQDVQVQFVATQSGVVNLELINLNNYSHGNDFAIDKLSLVRLGIVADLSKGRVYKNGNTDASSVDKLEEIENVVGTAFADRLTGDKNANVLKGMGGNDVLVGGAGNDVYQFAKGHGQDTVIDTDSTVGNTDQIVVGSGVSKEQLWFSRVGNDLNIAIIGSDDAIKVQDWYRGTHNHVEKLTLAGGGTLLSSNVDTLVQAMAQFAAQVAGQIPLPQSYPTDLTAVIASTWK